MSPGRRAYSLKKHFIVHNIVLFRLLTLRTTFKFAARRPSLRNNKMQRGLVTNTNDPSTSNQMLLDTFQY